MSSSWQRPQGLDLTDSASRALVIFLHEWEEKGGTLSHRHALAHGTVGDAGKPRLREKWLRNSRQQVARLEVIAAELRANFDAFDADTEADELAGTVA